VLYNFSTSIVDEDRRLIFVGIFFACAEYVVLRKLVERQLQLDRALHIVQIFKVKSLSGLLLLAFKDKCVCM